VDPAFFLAGLQAREGYEGQVAVARKLPARDARFREIERPLPERIARAMDEAGIHRFFAHQAEAIDRLREGRHTIVATGTASGKTLCYHVPVFEALCGDDEATVLYLSPTKALAQDQLRQIERFRVREIRAETYDGDTPSSARAGIRRHANLLLTNPDMLHFGILPHHELWSRLLRGLRFVVVDEAHVLRGVFGSHVALILRRLRRVARSHRADPVFALASATIGNPADHARTLTGLDVEAVTDDGSPHGERHLVFWNPPFLDADERGKRRSSNYEAATLLSELARTEAKALAFSKTRVGAELVARYARDRMDIDDRDRIASYRSGYLASERREIEAGLQSGVYAGVSATNALELGIDIGDLDAVVLNGFPGTVASAWQQAGRAGRSGQSSLAVVVPQDEPLDQYYAAHPSEFFAKPHEAALVNPHNPHILRPHLGCAAYERPLHAGDETYFGTQLHELVAQMRADGELRERRGRLYWSRRTPPAQDVDIRSAGGAPFRIVERATGRLIGTVDDARVFSVVHPGAIYLHQSETYGVHDLVIADRVALVDAERAQEYTQAKTASDLVVLKEERRSDALGGVGLASGIVEVTEQVVAYQRKRVTTNEVIEIRELDLPPQSLTTRAVWYTIPEPLLLRILPVGSGGNTAPPDDPPDVLLGSLHAAEHAGIGILPVFAMCDRWDIGGLSTNLHPDTGEPTIFIYDGHPMGAGIAEHAFDVARDHLYATMVHVRDCPCEAGCPSCVQSPKCGNWNEPLHKAGAVTVLRAILDA
jgi:DEAD/DEAH box helicase domain-containing protein